MGPPPPLLSKHQLPAPAAQKELYAMRHKNIAVAALVSAVVAVAVLPLLASARRAPPPRPAQWSWSNITVKVSSTGPANTLPSFFFMAGSEEGGSLYGSFGWHGLGPPQPVDVPTFCPAFLFNNTMPDLRVPQLPWAKQDDFGCERELRNLSVFVLENDFLVAKITPQYGGKIWSLYDKRNGREMVYNSPAHQPANIGYRDAWVAGGIEWNWGPGHIGHSVFTEEPVHMAVLPSSRGPVVRVYEYDRQNHTVWSVDILLDGDILWARPSISNPAPREMPGYWWTCVAMPVTDGVRIITPATASFSPCAPWPRGAYTSVNTTFRGPDIDHCADTGSCAWQDDMSYLAAVPSAHDFFMLIPPDKRPFLAHLAEDNYTVVHSHPKYMLGTKVFTWGSYISGMFQQDFLSASDYEHPNCTKPYYDPFCSAYKHEGRYTELQVGVAPSQMHTFPIAANSTYRWAEWFKGFVPSDPARARSPVYSEAVDEIDGWLESPSGVSEAYIAEMDAFFAEMDQASPTSAEMVHMGMPWGALRRAVTKGARIASPATPFPDTPPATDDTRMYLDLLANGTFTYTLELTPTNFEISDEWMALVRASLAAGHDTWLHHLLIGTRALEVGNPDEAKAAFQRSLELKRSVHGLRNLAIFSTATAAEAADLYEQAWTVFKAIDPTRDPASIALGKDLSREMAAWLMLNSFWDRLESLIQDLRSEPRFALYLTKDRLLHAQAALALHKGDFRTTMAILSSHCFPTYGSVRAALIDLWWKANVLQEEAAKGGAALSLWETLALRQRLGCDADDTTATLSSPCLRGPPNLGLPYGSR